ncbi:hypothetical protein Goshw_011589, partial [Gossypium schwendimanii]|nr:hypothetical protein [Gossypium schwendimanii]
MPAIYLNAAPVYEVGSSLRWIIFWTTDNQLPSRAIAISVFKWVIIIQINLYNPYMGDEDNVKDH